LLERMLIPENLKDSKPREPHQVSIKSSLNLVDNPFSNNAVGEVEGSSSESEYMGRIQRNATMKANPLREKKFYKVIIPYNFDNKKYTLNPKEIEFYENKNYIIRKLKEFNNTEAFKKVEQDFQLKPAQKWFFLYIPTFILAFIVIYIALLMSAFFSFNLFVMLTFGYWIRKGYNSLQMFKFILLEKFKIKEIHKILDEENKSSVCMESKLKWILGESGYWLEVQKKIE